MTIRPASLLALGVLLVAGIFVPLILSGQVTIENLAAPNPGDSLTRYVVLNPDNVEVTPPGEDVFWDWVVEPSNIQGVRIGVNDDLVNFPAADFVWIRGVTKTYYRYDTVSWRTVGVSGEDPVGLGIQVESFYTPPLPDVYVPVEYLTDAFNTTVVYTGIPLSIFPDSIINMLPLVPDSLRAAISFQQRDTVDSWGTLAINETTYDVLRQYRQLRIAVRVEAKISILPWTDVTELLLEFIDFLPGEVSLTDTIQTYRFLTPEYPQPVAILTVNDAMEPTQLEYAGEMISSSVELQKKQFTARFYPNPANDLMHIEFPEHAGGQVFLNLHTLTGELLASREFSTAGVSVIAFPTGELPDGPVAAVLRDSKGVVIAAQILIIRH